MTRRNPSWPDKDDPHRSDATRNMLQLAAYVNHVSPLAKDELLARKMAPQLRTSGQFVPSGNTRSLRERKRRALNAAREVRRP